MTKTEQADITRRCENVVDMVENWKNWRNDYEFRTVRKLRNCTAEIVDVYAKDGRKLATLLRSYKTIVAAYDGRNTVYDFLRLVYGYTATSAQHVRKFAEDMGATRVLVGR